MSRPRSERPHAMSRRRRRFEKPARRAAEQRRPTEATRESLGADGRKTASTARRGASSWVRSQQLRHLGQRRDGGDSLGGRRLGMRREDDGAHAERERALVVLSYAVADKKGVARLD